ncbi:agmatinase [Aestuariispira insulae]|uniref:Agmatinase n=1 Tax=Aestuariispira insulae TaxID=1461337 RepID=A0A3D9HW24_9PROT|nr:agmatinase [Aestuariispira insulae]RED53615.1 agmatinase [Aestuariispira insulae]
MSVEDYLNHGDQAFRKEELYGRDRELTYAGAQSFLRRKYTRDLTGVDVAVTGIPLDLATTYRPGARQGPQAVRAGSVQLAELDAFPFGFDPFDYLAVVDYGDCYFDHGFQHEIPDAITNHVRQILDSGASSLCIGGDHFVTYPILRAYVEKHGPLSLIHFDAHADTWPDDGQPMNHGTMFTRAVKEGLVIPENSVQIGIRTIADDVGFNILHAPWVHENGVQAVLDRVSEIVGDRKAYLTFDIDCLDPAYAPGTGTPVAGGLTSHQALSIVRGFGDLNLVGMDIVEVAPAYDHAEITAIAAATLAHDYLCLQADKKRKEKS